MQCHFTSVYCWPFRLIIHFYSFFLDYTHDPRDLPSFPTRRSSDLSSRTVITSPAPTVPVPSCVIDFTTADRKSTRLNSSHLVNSYAVFCLKKKKASKSKTRVFFSEQTMLCVNRH